MVSVIDLLAATNFVPSTWDHILRSDLAGVEQGGWDYIFPLSSLNTLPYSARAVVLPFYRDDAVKCLSDSYGEENLTFIPLSEDAFAVDEARLREAFGGKSILWATLYDAMYVLQGEILDELRDEMRAFVIIDARLASPPVIRRYADYADALIVGLGDGYVLTRNYPFYLRNVPYLSTQPDEQWTRFLSAAALLYTKQPQCSQEIHTFYERLGDKIFVPDHYEQHNGVIIKIEGHTADEIASKLATSDIKYQRFPSPSYKCFDGLVFDENDVEGDEFPNLVVVQKEDTTSAAFAQKSVLVSGQHLSGNLDRLVSLVEEMTAC